MMFADLDIVVAPSLDLGAIFFRDANAFISNQHFLANSLRLVEAILGFDNFEFFIFRKNN